jgi:hypothetical protein
MLTKMALLRAVITLTSKMEAACISENSTLPTSTILIFAVESCEG